MRVIGAAFAMGGVGRWLLTVVWTLVGAGAVVARDGRRHVGAARGARGVSPVVRAVPTGCFCCCSLSAPPSAGAWPPRQLAAGARARAAPSGRHVEPRAAGVDRARRAALWAAPGARISGRCRSSSPGCPAAITPPAKRAGVRAASVVVLAVAGTLWLRDTVDLLRFIVAVFGRLPSRHAGLRLRGDHGRRGADARAAVHRRDRHARPLLRPSLMTALLLLAVSVTAGAARTSRPAYTYEQPLRRYVRALQEAAAPARRLGGRVGRAGLDLGDGAPGGWTPSATRRRRASRGARLPYPFVFRTTAPPLGPAPVAIAAFPTTPVAGGVELTVTVVPAEPGLWRVVRAARRAHAGRSNLPGVRGSGAGRRPTSLRLPKGVTFRASFRGRGRRGPARTAVVVTTSGASRRHGLAAAARLAAAGPRGLDRPTHLAGAGRGWTAACAGPAIS